MILELKSASMADLENLLHLVQEFHQLEGVNLLEQQRVAALKMLLENAELGGIWLICCTSQIVGYIVLCFGYSIEFSGQDAFIDEFYIQPVFQGKGLGKQTLELVKTLAKKRGLHALHLEVERSNLNAQKLYKQANFETREKYVLMSVKLSDHSAIIT